ATQLVPQIVFGFDPGIQEIAKDAERAQKLMQDAGLPKGFAVTLHTRPVLEEAAAAVRQDLAQIGIGVDVRGLPNTEFFALKSGATLWIDRYASNSGDASDFLEKFVHSADPGGAIGSSNFGGYANADLDKKIERSAMTDDVDERRHMLQDVMATTM